VTGPEFHLKHHKKTQRKKKNIKEETSVNNIQTKTHQMTYRTEQKYASQAELLTY
jgi:hypothetical protein